ncbi:MAG: RHS repeat-associated core domain-containing protein [Blastocatellia bacterium]|nr:RHS repeat-associated core domain-containing protein [Blastocatellia bacterium]
MRSGSPAKDRSALTGLDYAINRTYDSKQGRFTQVDPIGMAAASLGAPQTLNLYTYCGNDPVNRVDPSGLFWGWIKKFFSWIVNTIRTSKLVRRVVIRFVVSFVMSGGNLGVAVRSIIPEILAGLGLAPPNFAHTPSWNPNLPYPITFGVGSLSRYIIRNLDSVRLLTAINACIRKVFKATILVAIAFRAATRKRNGLLTLRNNERTFNIETGVNFSTSTLYLAYGASKGYDETVSDALYKGYGIDGFAPDGDSGSTFNFRGGTYSNDPRRANYVA